MQKQQQAMPSSTDKMQQQQQQLLAQTMSDADMKKACEKVIDAVRQNDLKKIKRYLTRYANHASKVSYRSYTFLHPTHTPFNLMFQ